MQTIRRLVVEAHHRSLWQVFTVYVAVAWGAYQIISALPALIGVPDWVSGMSVVLFLIGLPIVLATAFVQEGGPIGPRAAPALAPAPDLTLLPAQAAEGADGIVADDPDSGGTGTGSQREPGTSGPVESERPQRRWAAASAATHLSLRHRLFTWKRAFIGAGLALLLLTTSAAGYMGMRVAGIGPFGSLRGSGDLAADDILILADFNATPDTTLGDVITEALRIDLGTGLRIADPAAIESALARMQRAPGRVDRGLARDIAEREGFAAIIAGEVGQLGASYVLTAEVLRTSDGATLASFRRTARQPADLLDATERLSRDIREKAGESLKSINRSASLEQVTTSSLAALRKYTAARRGAPGGLQLLEEAVALDSTFAMAHRARGAMLENAARRAEAREAFAAAFRHRHNLTPFERALLEADYHSIVMRDYGRALNAYREALAIDSMHGATLNNASLLLNDMLQFAAAESLGLRGAALPQPYPNQLNHLFQAQFALGKLDEAAATSALFESHYPNSAAPHAERALIAFHRGDYAAVDSIASVLEARPNPSGGWALREAMAVSRGQIARAIEHRQRQRTRALQNSGNLPLGELWLAMDMAQLGVDTARALAMIDEYVRFAERIDIPLLDQPVETIALAYAIVGRLDRARDYLALAEQRQELPGANPFTTTIQLARARIALLEGRGPDAILPLHQAKTPCDVCIDLELGRIFDAIGQPDSAVAYLERFVNTPRADQPRWRAANRSLAILRLAELYDAFGDRANAAEYYARIVELWADADPHLQPRVDAARRRLVELRIEP